MEVAGQFHVLHCTTPWGNCQRYQFNGRTRGGVVFKAQRYKPAGRGFDSRWCHWNFFSDIILLVAPWPWNQVYFLRLKAAGA